MKPDYEFWVSPAMDACRDPYASFAGPIKAACFSPFRKNPKPYEDLCPPCKDLIDTLYHFMKARTHTP